MRVVVQRVTSASVTVNNKVTGSINDGLLLLVGIHEEDTPKIMKWVSDKIIKLRIFEDDERKMNRSIKDVGGELLVVSQFTLYGDVQKGTRPSFIKAAKPDKAEPLYNEMIRYLEQKSGLNVESGIFGEMMDVSLNNNGPVTIVVEKE